MSPIHWGSDNEYRAHYARRARVSEDEKSYLKMCAWLLVLVLCGFGMIHCGSSRDMEAIMDAPATYQGIPPTDAEIAAALADYEAGR